MGLEDEARRKAAEIHRQYTQKAVDLILKDGDLTRLNSILDPTTAEVYRRALPKHAELCKLDQTRGLNDTERADLAVTYASLYPTFGDEGIVKVAAAWLATKPIRQARGN